MTRFRFFRPEIYLKKKRIRLFDQGKTKKMITNTLEHDIERGFLFVIERIGLVG